MNWIELNGTSLRYELSGSGKTTLVLVHEMGGTLDSWDQVLPALNHARRVLVVGIGESGAGKSSLLSLLLRFAEPTQGDIRIGGQRLSDIAFLAVNIIMRTQ